MLVGRYNPGVATGPSGDVYAFGGYNGVNAMSSVESFDPTLNTWSARADMPSARRAFAAAAGSNGKIYVFGGFGPGNFASDVDEYSPTTNTWTTVTTIPTPRSNLGAVEAGGKIYTFGGTSGSSSQDGAVEAYDLATDTWTTMSPMLTPRSHLAFAKGTDGRIYAISGLDAGTSFGNATNIVEAYDPQANAWSSVSPIPTPRASAAAALGSDGRIYVVGGYLAGDFLSTVEAYDPLTDTWTTEPDLPTAREGLGATTGGDGAIYALGGELNGTQYLNVAEAFVLSAQPTEPSEPLSPNASPGNGRATVSWTTPSSDGGSPITGYTVHTTGGTQSVPPVQVGAGVHSTPVNGLVNATLYTFTVVATNAIGDSPPSTAVTATPQAFAVPSPPRSPTGTPGNGTIRVSWLTPSSPGGAPIDSYTVVNTFVSSGSLVPDTTVNAPSLFADIGGLSNGVAYRFRVYATNAGGNSQLSPQTALITPRTVPDPPTIGTASPGPSRAIVRWTAPASNGGSAITGYTITTYLNGSAVGNPVNAGANATSVNITGLTNGQSYRFTVYARSAAGNGGPSTLSNVVTPSSPPGAPAAPTAVAGSGSAQVSWSPPASNGGGAITSYTVTSNTGGFSVTVDGSITSTTMSGLSNGTSYRFRVQATNAAGTGPNSPLSLAVIPRGNPLAPSGVVVAAGDRIALVQWSAPASNGGNAITEYVVTAHPGGESTTVTMPNSTVPGAIVSGLDNGTPYTFTVSARNASGLGPDSAPSASVTPLSSARTVVFSSSRSGSSGFDIWAIDEAGLVSVRLLFRTGTDTGARISPDRTKIVFASGANNGIDIWTMNIDGTGLTPFPGNSAMADTAPNWSPDGTRLALQSARHDENPQISGTDYEIWIVDVNGTNPHQLTHTANNVNDTFPDWSPDGARVVFTSNRPGSLAPANQELWTVSASGGSPTQLTARADGDISATWSVDRDPSSTVDNSRIAFTSTEPGGVSNIYVINPDGTGLTLLTGSQTVTPHVGAWASNGQELIISARQPGSGLGTEDLYRLMADGVSAPVRLTTAVGVDSAPDWAGTAPPGVVERQGTELRVDGQSLRFTGVNIYNANSDGWCWYAMDAPILEDSFAAIGPGTKVIRAWFFQPLATTKGPTRLRDWSRFDHTLQAADEAGVKVIVTLTDQWGECGSDQPNGYKDAAWYQSGYEDVQPGNLVSYRDWVQEVVTRYRDDPRIAFWQLINEAEYGERLPDGSIAACPQGTNLPADVLKAWATDVSGLVKSIDPNHLVSLGSIGNGQCGMQGAQYKYVHDIPTIDLCEYHDYGSPLDPLPGDQFNGLEARVQQCNDLDKPLFLGEVGIIPNDVGGSLQDRADAFAAKRDAMFALGVDGFLMWAWNINGSTLDNYDIGPGDPSLT